MSKKYNSLSPREIVLLPLLAISSSQASIDQSKTATYPILKIYNSMGTLNQFPGSEIKAAGDKGIDKWQWSYDQLLLATEGKIQQQKRLAKKKTSTESRAAFFTWQDFFLITSILLLCRRLFRTGLVRWIYEPMQINNEETGVAKVL